jgi:hypothetical protein
LGLRNSLGLLAEEYDPINKRLLGNFPQALSHLGLINTAHNLTGKLHLPKNGNGAEHLAKNARSMARRKPKVHTGAMRRAR